MIFLAFSHLQLTLFNIPINILSKNCPIIGLQTSSNILPNALTSHQTQHTNTSNQTFIIDDIIDHPLMSAISGTATNHYSNKQFPSLSSSHTLNQKTSHHYSINRQRHVSSARMHDVDEAMLNGAAPIMSHEERHHQQRQHHNIVVSYENSLDKNISKEYSE